MWMIRIMTIVMFLICTGFIPVTRFPPMRIRSFSRQLNAHFSIGVTLATGWSIGWKINLWARLLDGDHAYKIIKNMLKLVEKDNPDGRTYPNMFDAHPPFQIDGTSVSLPV